MGKKITYLFNNMLLELSKLFRKLPKYLIEIMEDKYGIPEADLTTLTKRFTKNSSLTILKEENYYFTLNKKNA